MPRIERSLTAAPGFKRLGTAGEMGDLLVATVKGSLVACYFMHLISEKKLIYAVLGLTFVFFVVLLALPSLTVHDGFWVH